MKIATWIAYETVIERYHTFLCGGAHSSTASSDAPRTTASSSPPIMKISCFPNLIRETFKCPLSTSEYLVLQKGNWLFFFSFSNWVLIFDKTVKKDVSSLENSQNSIYFMKNMCASLHELFFMLLNPCLHMGNGSSLNFLLPDMWQMNLGKVHFCRRHGGFSPQVLSTSGLCCVPGGGAKQLKTAQPIAGKWKGGKEGGVGVPTISLKGTYSHLQIH